MFINNYLGYKNTTVACSNNMATLLLFKKLNMRYVHFLRYLLIPEQQQKLSLTCLMHTI